MSDTKTSYAKAWYVVAVGPPLTPSSSFKPRAETTARFNPDSQFPVQPQFKLPDDLDEKPPKQVYKPTGQWFFYYFILVLALCGLVFQLNDIANLYFQYETVTVFEIETPHKLKVPSLSLCFPYEQIADLDKVAEVIPAVAGIDPEKLTISNLSTLNLDHLFNMTPSEDDLTSDCVYRIPGSFKRMQQKGNCKGVFNVTKFYKQKFICYKFALIQNATIQNSTSNTTSSNASFLFDMIQNSLASPGIFYDLTLQISLPRVDEFQAVIHSPKLYPRGNKAFPISVSRVSAIIPFKDEQIKRKDFVFSFSYSLAINVLLAAPYESNCRVYGNDPRYESKEGCIDLCLTETIKEKMKKIPFSAVQLMGDKFPHISIEDNANTDTNEKIIEVREACNLLCVENNCYDEMFITKFIRSSYSEKLNFQVYVTNEPVISSTLKPKLQTVEFLIYVLSCFGIWFGASFYSFSAIINKLSSKCKAKKE